MQSEMDGKTSGLFVDVDKERIVKIVPGDHIPPRLPVSRLCRHQALARQPAITFLVRLQFIELRIIFRQARGTVANDNFRRDEKFNFMRGCVIKGMTCGWGHDLIHLRPSN